MAWLEVPAVATYLRSPFDVLCLLLAKECLDPVSDGRQVRFGHYTVNPAATRALRSRVIQKALDIVFSGHPKIAVAAIRLLEGALGDPVGFFGRIVSPEEKALWEEQLEVLRGIRDAASRVTEPIVLLKLRGAVLWSEARGHTTSIRSGARC